MPDPKGKLVTPVAFTVAGKLVALLSDDAGHLQLDIITSGLPLGAATAAKQLADDHNVKVTAVPAGVSTSAKQLADNHNVVVTALPAGLATSAKQLADDHNVKVTALPAGQATSANQTTMITALQLIDNLIAALTPAGSEQLRVDLINYPANIDIRDLAHAQDDILIYGKDEGGTARVLLTDENGGLIVSSAAGTDAQARAYLSSNQLNLTDHNYNQILLDAVTYDPSSIFAANKFTIKVAGYYMVTTTALLMAAGLVADKWYAISVTLNAAHIFEQYSHTSFVADLSLTANDIIHCNVDDEIELWIYPDSGLPGVDVYGAASLTYMCVHLLSAD